MYINFNLSNYEEATMGVHNQLRYIDAYAQGGYYSSNGYQDANIVQDPSKGSIYGRKMQSSILDIKRFIQDINQEIKETKSRTQYFADSGGRNGQRETEMRNVSLSLYKTKLDAIKLQANLEREIDKARKEDIKLFKDINGSVPDNVQILANNSDSSTLMNNLFSSGVDNFFSNNQVAIQTPTALPQVEERQPPVIEIAPKPEEINPDTILADLDKPVEPEPIPVQQPIGQITGVIKNALGQEIPLYEDGPDDFIEGKTYTNAKLAYENIELAKNPDVKKAFKFNKERGEGWIVNYNFKEGRDEDKGSTINVEQIYPFNIDKANNLATTVLRESYPLIMTDEIPPQDVQDSYKKLREIEANKKDK